MHDLGRGLLRRTSVAGGLAALAPVAMIAAAVVAGLGGGAGRLDGLGQALTGPPVPEAAAAAEATRRRESDSARARDPARLLANLPTRSAPSPRATERPNSPATRSPGSTGPAFPGMPAPTVQQPAAPVPAAPTPAPAPPAPGPDSPAPADPVPTVPPGDPPSAVGEVTDQVQTILEPIPTVGPPATEIVQTIEDATAPLKLP